MTDETCFIVTQDELHATNYVLTLGIDFGEPVFMHAITYFQAQVGWNHSNKYQYFENYEIYIGNDSDYNNNQKCAGGPFLNVDDPNSFVYHPKAEINDADPFGLGLGIIWPNGKEIWCNLEGSYLHIVADLNNLMT